jgi:Tol biopolymer transport system component
VGACLTVALAIPLALVGGESADAAYSLHPVAAQAEPCQAETKRLRAFTRKMASRKRAFFRTHRSRKQRRAFLTKQKKKLTALKRARARCLRNVVPPPGPPAPPAPPAPSAADTTPPELRIDAPGAEAWFAEANATVSGVARDGGSGISGVACNGQPAGLAGDAFTCQVPLSEGPNTIAVTASDAAGNASSAKVVVNHDPGGLSGESAATAAGAMKNVDTDPRHDDAHVSVTPEGLRIAREEIALRVAPSATVAQLNAALESVDGRIVGSIEGSPQLAVGIPDPGSLAALDGVLVTLRTQPGVDRAERADMPAVEELPTGFASPPSSTGGPILSHLLAMRMPAAWNARKAIDLSDRPTLIVADFFGNGELSPQVDATYNNSDLIVKPRKSEHGYHVVGIAASRFATNGTAAGNVTGVFPATTPLHVIEASDLSTQMTGVKIFQKATSLSGRVVVNTSLGWDVPVGDAEARSAGSDWAQLVRGSSGLEDRMFHATSAGNIAGPANKNSRFAAAALRTDLENQFALPMTPLRNTAAVENLRDTGSPAFEPGCLSTNSNRGGNIATVGEDVFSHLFGSQAGNKTGTSMASPAVAGLAMFLWSIEPTLTAPQMRELMIATARPALPNDAGSCGTEVTSAPRLDAYSAALGLDQAAAPSKQTAPVRHAVVDFDGDGTFDEDDLQSFNNVSRPTAGDRDWSRQDLNGDGFTGGTEKAPLDLDPTGTPVRGAPKLEKVSQEIQGVRVEFDEANVTDMQALCFWAYSNLYDEEASEDERADVLDPANNCGAQAKFTNGKLVAVGRSPRSSGQLFPPPRLWLIEPPAAPVTFTPEGESPAFPAWSPDGQRIAYSRGGTSPGLWIIGAGGQNPTRLTDSEGDLDPTWSPDGNRIAFRGGFRDPQGIYVVNAAGGTPTLIPGTTGLTRPSWSPDGRRIAAASQTGAIFDIFRFSPDGQNMQNVTNSALIEETAPDWSPGGGRIIFASDRPIPSDTVRRHRLWIIDADGSNLTQLTFPFGSNTGGTTVEDSNPAWSPDGLSVTFARSHQNNSRFVMTREIAASAAVPVTPLPSNTTDHTFDMPDWQPIPASE